MLLLDRADLACAGSSEDANMDSDYVDAVVATPKSGSYPRVCSWQTFGDRYVSANESQRLFGAQRAHHRG